MDFHSIRTQIADQKLTVSELVNTYLKNINEKNGDLNAFLEVYEDEVKEQATIVDAKIKAGTAGKLAGMVLSVKDNICYKGHKVSASSKILEGFESLYTATALQRLLDEDAIVIGRVNCDEFAMGSSNENSAYGNVKNPLNPDCVPGGSSGGSAASVAANMCTATLGSDTGGSIRQPAAFTNLNTIKPTYGSVSRYGLIAFASSFDQIGPLTHSMQDAALILDVMSGKDEQDSTSSSVELNCYSTKADSASKKIAVLKDAVEHPGLNSEIKEAFKAHLSELEAAGHEINYVDLPLLKYLPACYYVITTAEASSNLARYDGIHYGYRSKNAGSIEETYVYSRSEAFGEEVKRRILLGTFVLSAGYYDAYYTKAQKVRRLLSEQTKEILKDHDFIACPTTASPAFKIGEKADDPIALYLEDIFTVQANLTGMPAVSYPAKQKTKDNKSIGFQLIANAFEEKKLVEFTNAISQL